MFTWNLQYISKTRLSDALQQLMIDTARGDILVRIHTAIHTPEEAVDLAAFIRKIVPAAHIIGTSTPAVIHEGKLHMDQCLISVTQMLRADLRSVRFEFPDDPDDLDLSASLLCSQMKNALVKSDKSLMFVFFTDTYRDVKRFVDASNLLLPGVQMIGGVAGGNSLAGVGQEHHGFIFDDKGWSDNAVIAACIDGDRFDSVSSVVTGVQVVDGEMEITEATDNIIRAIDKIPAAAKYRESIGDAIEAKPELAFLFPLVYPKYHNAPFMFGYSKDGLHTNHNMDVGDKLQMGYIYDRKIIADNRSTFGMVESFEKAETLFAYSCRDRFRIYPNSVLWELSIYENSNISGCITEGEIGCIDGMNIFANCAFVLAAAGESESYQKFNPYVFSNADMIEADNNQLIDYLMAVESTIDSDPSMASNFKGFIRSCELKLLYTENESILNEAALLMDIKLKGYDRVCVIDVLDTLRMHMVFSEQRIDATHKRFVSRCTAFVNGKDYHVYLLDKWKIAIAAPSFMISLQNFADDMRKLQKELFETSEQYIAIVPVFCLINGCNEENLETDYNTARMEMLHKNIQFYICEGGSEEIDEDSIREKYHMVNVINYALANDKVIPYFQGIYDNGAKKIHHYEALIRLEDENGEIYYPGKFLDVARSFGLLYDELSKTMIRKVFEIFKDTPDKAVSINLGMRDIKNEDITNMIFGFLSTAKYPANFIFEILENEDVDDYELIIRFVEKIHKFGAAISIDDFGSGYSNLLHLASIPYDYIKIDGSIVKNCCNVQECENLIAMISSWRNLSIRNIKIVGEFVENCDIQNKLEKYDIDFSQGYLFSVPSPDIPDDNKDDSNEQK